MAGIKEVFSSITDWTKDLVNLGLAVALIFLVVDLLFGTTTNIVANLGELISSFTDKGVVGLIALIIFVAIYSK
jgi:hypothetical protein